MADQTPAAAAESGEAFNFKRSISQMVQRNASDLLLKVGRPPAVRLNGELNSLNMQPLRPEDLKALAEQIMTPRQIKEFAERKEADFAIGVPGVGRFRTNIYQQRGTLAFALRARFEDGEAMPRIGLRGTAKVYGERSSLFMFLFRRPLSALRQGLGL